MPRSRVLPAVHWVQRRLESQMSQLEGQLRQSPEEEERT